MKPNYQAWTIDFNAFPTNGNAKDQFHFLLNFAVLAPSSHNSQPWKFQVEENEISLLPDFTRALLHSDQNHRQLFISLGCTLKNLLVAADYYGFNAQYEYDYSRNGTPSIRVIFQKPRNRSTEPDHLIFSIPKRHTNRNKYENTPVPESLLEKFKACVAAGTQVYFITDSETKSKLAEIVTDAMVAAMDDKMFRKELSAYVKSNITSSPIGMPASGFGVPTPMSLLAPTMLRYVNMNKLSKKQDLALLKNHTPVFGIISTTEDNPRSWTEAGKIYGEIALLATKEGLNTAPMAAAIQIGEFYKDLQRAINTHYRPQVFFRIGYAEKIPPHSPRLHIEFPEER